MKNNNLIRFVQSLALLPIMTMSLSISGIHNIETAHSVLVKKVNIEANGTITLNQAVDPKAESLKIKAEAVDAYFAEHDMPLEGMGKKMVEEAEKNEIDWRLLPAIATRESTGGKFDCKKVENNPFGWGSCKIGFKSNEEAIEVVAKNLGGNNPKTAHHYDDKTTKQILRAYNPPSIVFRYAEQVISIMNTIGNEEISSTLAIAST
ncbi:MAG: hypothetical protein V1484_02540 [bacterium]